MKLSSIHGPWRRGAYPASTRSLNCLLILFLALPWASAQTIVNPSFEANTFAVSPGYAGGANGAITGWTGPSGATSFGLNPAGGSSPFADNGVVPDGNQVLFIHTNNSAISQTVTGFVVGAEYVVRYWENARLVDTPVLRAQIGGTGLLNTVIVPDHIVTSGQYAARTSSTFTALSPRMTFSFYKTNLPANDYVALIDHVQLTRTALPATPAGDSCAASGQLLVYDSFDYPTGQHLHEVIGGGLG